MRARKIMVDKIGCFWSCTCARLLKRLGSFYERFVQEKFFIKLRTAIATNRCATSRRVFSSYYLILIVMQAHFQPKRKTEAGGADYKIDALCNSIWNLDIVPDDNFTNANLIQFKFKFSPFIHLMLCLCIVILNWSSLLRNDIHILIGIWYFTTKITNSSVNKCTWSQFNDTQIGKPLIISCLLWIGETVDCSIHNENWYHCRQWWSVGWLDLIDCNRIIFFILIRAKIHSELATGARASTKVNGSAFSFRCCLRWTECALSHISHTLHSTLNSAHTRTFYSLFSISRSHFDIFMAYFLPL